MSSLQGPTSKHPCSSNTELPLPVDPHDLSLLTTIATEHLNKTKLKQEIFNLRQQELVIKKEIYDKKLYIQNLKHSSSTPFSSSSSTIISLDDSEVRQTKINDTKRQILQKKGVLLVLAERICRLESKVLDIALRKGSYNPPVPAPSLVPSSSSSAAPLSANVSKRTREEYTEASSGNVYQRAVSLTDNNEKFRLIKIAADNGYAPAIYDLGYCFQKGIGTPIDPVAGFNCFTDSAGTGCAKSLYALGLCYLEGLGTLRNPEAAFNCFKAAASKGCEKSLHGLGICYSEGLGTPRNPEAAFNCFKASADKKCNLALFELGKCYLTGIGTPQNPKAAVNCFRRAVRDNDLQALIPLGGCYEAGVGRQKNLQKALNCYTTAAEKGVTGAQQHIDRVNALICPPSSLRTGSHKAIG